MSQQIILIKEILFLYFNISFIVLQKTGVLGELNRSSSIVSVI